MIGPVADLADLAVGDRLARAGISPEESAMLVEMDPRIVADAATATSAAVERLARWLRAGQPVADLRRLQFDGDDTVLALIEELIARVPAPIGWHASEFVEWIEIGRRADGTLSGVRSPRAPAGDVAHRIRICGARSDERIRELLPHELAHSLHRMVCKLEPEWQRSLTLVEQNARLLMVARDMGMDQPEVAIADMRADEELLAEATAQAWGYSRPPLMAEALRRRRKFIAEINDAAELVPKS